jgi:hypothetical protein
LLLITDHGLRPLWKGGLRARASASKQSFASCARSPSLFEIPGPPRYERQGKRSAVPPPAEPSPLETPPWHPPPFKELPKGRALLPLFIHMRLRGEDAVCGRPAANPPGHSACKTLPSSAPVRPQGLPREKNTVEERLHASASLQHQASLSACHGACLKKAIPAPASNTRPPMRQETAFTSLRQTPAASHPPFKDSR